ncbi:MAG: hypothetical protein KF902_01480 [Phycisphaeraceae bacterium]|nr:hypothetical protein [Phycisphaeraceae bacterium]MCW5767865.1 hypothetical protein [Phycisphaeraceae bacterium]
MSADRERNQSSAAVARARFVAIAMAALLVCVGIGLSVGLASWVAAPLLILLGVVGTVALLRANDLLSAEREWARRELVREVWERVGDSPVAGPETTSELAERIDRSGQGIRERRDALEALVVEIDVAIIGLDPSGVAWIANDAAHALFGPSLEGRHVEEIFTQPVVVALASGARRGSARQARVRLARPGGALILDVSAMPLGSRADREEGLAPGVVPAIEEDGVRRPRRCAVAMTFRDVTELATAVQLKTDFVANASHELRTPLAAIRASVETIQDAADDDPEARARFLRTIAGATTRLEDLCRDLMDLSKVESVETSVERVPVSMDALADELSGHFESACAERTLTLCFEIDPRARVVRTDQRLFGLILRNLIENSTKFAYAGSTVRVVMVPGALQSDLTERAELVVEVVDSGIGIPIGLQARIFERFFQADPARAGNGKRGTGLGLAIVKHAVRALGGRISVHSVWKQGTTMRVELPDAVETGPAGGDARLTR